MTATEPTVGAAQRPAIPQLDVEDLEVVYNGSVRALSGVTLSVPPGAFVSVLGANGAGKTSLVRAIAGLLFVHDGAIRAGTVRWGDLDLARGPIGQSVRGGIALVPEGRMIFGRLSVHDNLLAGAATRTDRDGIEADLAHVYRTFPQIADRRNAQAGYLSGGEQQMVAVGRALMAKPKLLILDELSLGLAPLIVEQLFDQISELRVEQGMSVLCIEQNARMALQHATYAYLLETGGIVVEGPAEELRHNPHVEEYYLGGAGDAKDAYRDIVARFADGGAT